MDAYIASWLLLVAVLAAAAVSPGPDFVVAVRNALLYGRRTGLFTAIGFGLGVGVHAAYTLAGLGAVIAHSATLFLLVKYAGAAYLIYLGVQALRSQGMTQTAVDEALARPDAPQRSDWAALRDGFITNLFNPKAVMFFVALFTQVISPDMPLTVKLVFGLTSVVVIASWFALVACFMTLPAVRRRYIAFSKTIDRALGVFLLGFGLKLALSSR